MERGLPAEPGPAASERPPAIASIAAPARARCSTRVLLDALLEIESLLLIPTLELELSRQHVDVRVIQASLDGLAAYVEGDKTVAVENLADAAEAIVLQLESSGVPGWQSLKG